MQGDGCLIYMSDKQYLNKFINKYDIDDYSLMVVSDDVRMVSNKFPNITVVNFLMIPSYLSKSYINKGDYDTYERDYREYLSKEEIIALLLIILHSIVNKSERVILLCSKRELDYYYLEILSDFIEDNFGLKAYSLKEFMQQKIIKINNKDIIRDNIKRAKEYVNKYQKEKNIEFLKELKNIKNNLDDLTWGELYDFAKSKRLAVKKSMTKKKIIKIIIKQVKKNPEIINSMDEEESDFFNFYDNEYI